MNATLAQAEPASGETARRGTWRLTGRMRKTVLVLHIVAGGTWFGLDVAMAVLVFTAISADSAAVRAHTLQSLGLVTVWPMFSAAMLSLITGILLGVGSKYGLIRYWWVAIKLGLNLLLATLVVTALRGEVNHAVDLGQAAGAGRRCGLELHQHAVSTHRVADGADRRVCVSSLQAVGSHPTEALHVEILEE